MTANEGELPAPYGVSQINRVDVDQDDVKHASLPIKAVSEGTISPKSRPDTVTSLPPKAAAFRSGLYDRTGASKLKAYVWVPMSFATLTTAYASMDDRAPSQSSPSRAQIMAVLVVQDAVTHHEFAETIDDIERSMLAKDRPITDTDCVFEKGTLNASLCEATGASKVNFLWLWVAVRPAMVRPNVVE